MSVLSKAKNFYRKHPKLVTYGGIGAGVALFGGIVYAATRPKPTNNIANLIATSSQFIPYSRTIKGAIELDALTKRLQAMGDALASNSVVFVQPDAFKKIFMHQGVKVLDFVPSIFYKNNQFTTDNLASQSWCKTLAAQVVGLGNDWLYPFYHTVYREPDVIVKQKSYKGPGGTWDGTYIDVHYAGNAIPADDPRFQQRVDQAINDALNSAIKNADFGGALKDLEKFGVKLPFTLPGDVSSMLMIAVPPGTKQVLERFAIDFAAKNNKPLPTTDPDGKPLSPQALSLLRASAGAMIVAGVIDMFESHDAKTNPCIKELDAGLVFELFMATIGTVLSLAVGPALSGVSVAIKFATTVNKLAELSQ